MAPNTQTAETDRSRGAGKEKISISLPTPMVNYLDKEAQRTGESRSLIIRQALRKHAIDTDQPMEQL